MGYLQDDAVLRHMDEAILSASPHLSSLMACLFNKGFTPVGQVPALIFSMAHLATTYEGIRMDGGEPEESFELAQALTLRHPVAQRLMAEQVASAVDSAAGV